MACLLGVAALPLVRGDETFRSAGVRVAAVAFLALVAGVVLSRPALIPLAAILVGGLYGAELAIADEPLDVAAPAVAAGLLLSVELAFWSLEERGRWRSDPGENFRRGAFVALLCVAALLVSALLLALVDTVRARGLALDLLGATAAAAVLVTVLVAARRQVRNDH